MIRPISRVELFIKMVELEEKQQYIELEKLVKKITGEELYFETIGLDEELNVVFSNKKIRKNEKQKYHGLCRNEARV